MRCRLFLGCLFAGLLGSQSVSAQEPAVQQLPPVDAPIIINPMTPAPYLQPAVAIPEISGCADCERPRSFLESDHAFDNFIGPVSNPIFSKDPRSLTEARVLFLQNWAPKEHPVLGGGDFQAVAMQVRVALTDRLTFIADKDGYAFIHPNGGGSLNGWLDIAAGLKYTFIRDEENQLLVAGGFMYELPSGDGDVFQNHGDGIFTAFLTAGKEFGEVNHFLATVGQTIAANSNQNSNFFYMSLHLDRQVMKQFYPLVELNWFHYTSSGTRLPAAIGEGDGLVNFGTSGVTGNDLVTVAAGMKWKPSRHFETAIVAETPVSNRKDLLDARLTFEAIFRY